LGGAGLAAAGGGEQGGVRIVRPAHGLPYAAPIDEHGAVVGQEAPGALVVGGGEGEFIALLGESRQLEVRAEIVGSQFYRFYPARDAFRQRVVDIAEGLFGGGVAGFADAVEDAARLGLLPGFVAEEGVLEGGGGFPRGGAPGLAGMTQ